MRKVIILLIAFSLQTFLTQKVFGSDKTNLVQEIADNAWEISNLVKSNLSSNEVQSFFNELKNSASEEAAQSIIKNYLGESNSVQFHTHLNKILDAGNQLKSLNISQSEFDDIVTKINTPKEDEYAGGCNSRAGYDECIKPCNGASAWGMHAWAIIWSTTGGVGSGAALGSLFGVGAPIGAVAGGLYGFYEGWSSVGEKYGDCITKCYDYYCRGIDTRGPRPPGGGYLGGDKTAH